EAMQIFLILHMNKPPFNDPRVRRAGFLATDRQGLGKIARCAQPHGCFGSGGAFPAHKGGQGGGAPEERGRAPGGGAPKEPGSGSARTRISPKPKPSWRRRATPTA